jgi:hypothetical protein
MSIDAKILGSKGPPHVFEALGKSWQVLPMTRATKVGFQKYHLNKLVRELEPTKEFTSPERYQQKLDAIVDQFEASKFRFEAIFTNEYLHSEDGICELTAYMMQCTEDEAVEMITTKCQELSAYLRLAVGEGKMEPHGGDVSPN